ncbi:MAG TPA: cobalamin biosynthesis protein [Bacillus bacterium]|nr:cobalamin biosynthesis protein [Bacillus sp. (in: firmicutes)]
MHFVTGGAFQGKRSWVSSNYRLNVRDDWKWHNYYEDSDILMPNELLSEKLVILEGLEEIVKHSIIKEDVIRKKWKSIFHAWKTWELAEYGRTVIFIGCDISKGIVPILESDRKWRDITGWCYQELASLSSRVDIIWNGLAQTIKSEGDE